MFSRMSATSLNMTCCRCITDVAFHAGNAFCADSTAALSSASVDWGTRVTRLLVAGSGRSIHWEVWEGTNWLSMKLVVSTTFWIFS